MEIARKPPLAIEPESQPAKSTAQRSQAIGGEKPSKATSPTVKTVVKPVANAIGILRYLGEVGAPSTVTQIARHLNINTSTCFNILRTLVGEGVVDFNARAKSYSVGLGMLKLVKNVYAEDQHVAAAAPLLRELAEELDITLCLWRRESDRITLVAVEHNSGDLRVHIRMGQRLPMLIGSTGRALAMHTGASKSELRAQFKLLRWSRSLPFETYWREANEADKRGWAVDDGYFSVGILTVAALVFDSTGYPAYSLVAATFRGQHNERGIARIGQRLVKLSQTLTNILY